MGKKLQTIYEYFKEYSKEDIDKMIYELSDEEKFIIKTRFGDDLNNPKQGENWNKEISAKYYGSLIPKMKRILKNNCSKETSNKSKLNSNNTIKGNSEEKKQSLDNIGLMEISSNDIKIYPNLLLEEIKHGKTNNEICEKFNIPPNVLYKALLNLKNNGINVSRKYYSDGSINYKSISNITEVKKSNFINYEKTIITDCKEDNMKFLVISDLHFGNKDERLDLINRAFNYCAKNGINNILCGGDFIDGAFSQGEQNIKEIYQQIEYFIKNYPSDKNILTYGVGGDHDMSALTSNCYNFIDICNNLRHDVIIGGFNNTKVNIKNDLILLYHYIHNGEICQSNAPIIFHGHSHKYATSFVNDILNVTIPSLSNIVTDIPTALELEISFSKGFIKNVIIKQIYFGEKDIVLNEQVHDLLKNREITYTPIKNIEQYKSKILIPEKKITKVKQPLSQIEKFNQKFGR